MAERFIEEDVRTRLILSGLVELCERGVHDFSLRRAADAAGVSCAAPYRYFKSKEEYIGQIFFYVSSKWELLVFEISRAYAESPEKLVVELCTASVRFWLSNQNLRTALMLSGGFGGIKLSSFDNALVQKLVEFFASRDVGADAAQEKANAVRALLIGYVTLIGSGELEAEPALASLKSTLIELFAIS